jgi:hypothetical protein
MTFFSLIRLGLLACLTSLVVVGCNTVKGNLEAQVSETNHTLPAIALAENTSVSNPTDFPQIITDANGQIQVEALPVDPSLRNEWTPELEAAFWQRANAAIRYYAGQDYGNTSQENEKRSYPYAMFDFLAGDRQKALDFLQGEDAQVTDHAQTGGIDYYYAFTLKGQMRKYFFFGKWLDPAYRQRMFEGAKLWTEEDPAERPHPVYGNGDGTGDDWSMARRGKWVDTRSTDNLRAMRETSIYLMAEETGNEAVRQLYKQKIQRYVWALYHIGMGEWDSSNYHGHTFAPYLNLYDFAQDPEVKQLAKAALDWLSAAAAVKYRHGAWGGPVKRDHGESNVVFASASAKFFWQYFGDTPQANPEPERDVIHAITSRYRPPLAVVELAHKHFDKPTELLSSKPTYENWKPGGEDQPAYWETAFWGQTYQMGSVVSAFPDGDVAPFKLMADNSQRGVDFFVANTGGRWVGIGKKSGDQIGQYRNLLLWLRLRSDDPFFFQLPETAEIEQESDIWFVRMENTWLALHPIHLSNYEAVEIPDQEVATAYQAEQTLKAMPQGSNYAGFALEVGEPNSHHNYDRFKQAVLDNSKLDLGAIAQGTAQLTGSTGETLTLRHNPDNELPFVVRNGETYDWSQHFDLYRPMQSDRPISLGWKQGRLNVTAGGKTFLNQVDNRRS